MFQVQEIKQTLLLVIACPKVWWYAMCLNNARLLGIVLPSSNLEISRNFYFGSQWTKNALGDQIRWMWVRVNRPITDRLPMTEHFGRFFQFFSILSDLKCYRSAFSSSTNYLWNAKPKDKPKKSCKKNMFFRILKLFFLFFFSFWPLLLSNLITFLFLIHFK
jgi:hypothetical protein